MPSFRDQPVTWLFLAATAAVAVVGVSMASVAEYSQNTGPGDRDWFMGGLLCGVVFAMGAYAVLGGAHRLLRAAACLLGIPVVAAAIAILIRGSLRNVMQPLAVVGVMQAAAALGAVAAWVGRRLLARRRKAGTTFRYPLVEFFGWTIVVAVAALIARYAPFAKTLGHPDLATWGSAAMAAGLCVGVALLTPGEGTTRTMREKLALAGASFSLIVAIVVQLAKGSREEGSMLATSLAYVLVLVFCMVIDGAPQAIDDDNCADDVSPNAPPSPTRDAPAKSPFD